MEVNQQDLTATTVKGNQILTKRSEEHVAAGKQDIQTCSKMRKAEDDLAQLLTSTEAKVTAFIEQLSISQRKEANTSVGLTEHI